MTAIHESKNRITSVLSILRGLGDLSRIGNETIAQLNNLAYKAIQKGGLQKMLDKRALQNEERYE